MKKMIAVIIFIFLIFIGKVKAVTPTIKYIDDVYSNRIVNGEMINGKFGYIYMYGQFAFCIEPMKIIGTNYEVDNSILDNYYTKEEQEKIKLIVYYGASRHYNNPNYYMATQELIWRIKNEGDFYFTKTPDFNGERIDIEKYKEEILSEIENHYLYPSFKNITITPKKYDLIELKDENNVINNYYIYNNSKNIIYTENNTLKLNILDEENTIVNFEYDINYGTFNNTYIGDGQTLITRSINEHRTFSLDINPSGISYYFNIKFYEGNNQIYKKIKFKIFDTNKSQFINNDEVFETDVFGNFASDFKLDIGTYEILYVDIPKGYISPSYINKIILNENSKVNDNNRYEFISYLDIPHGELNIKRQAIKYDGSLQNLDEIEYKIYAYTNIYDNYHNQIYKKDELVNIIKIDEGTAKINLPLGKYYLVEGDNNYGLKKENIRYFSFEYKDSITDIYYVNLNIITELPKLCFQINTYKEQIDRTYIGYDNFKYELYSKEDIYYLNEIAIKKGTLITELTSNIDGIIISNLSLPYGIYELKEITKENNYYDNENIEINFLVNNFNSYNNYKKLKRGNLKIEIITDLIDYNKIIKILFDKEYTYIIDKELLIKDIVTGKYSLFHDIKYDIIIHPNETTILKIYLEDNKIEDTVKEEIKEEDNKIEDTVKEEIKEDNNKIEDTVKEENSNGLEEDNIEEIELNKEYLPDTYDYLKRYNYLFKLFIIAALIIRVYEFKNN